MKIITIGDIHGESNWINFEDIKIVIEHPFLKTDFDKYIFVGDYTDSFTKTNVEIKDTLLKLIQFKKNYPDNVILLWGNHDVEYFYNLKKGKNVSGFRPEAFWDLHIIFNENKDLFQLSYQYKNYIWTHAGIHQGWYEYEFNSTLTPIADELNLAFLYNDPTIHHCGYRRGGFNRNGGGPLWVDKLETWIKPLKGYHQIVGHTPVDDIKINYPYKDNKNTSVTYVDCVKKNKYYILEIE